MQLGRQLANDRISRNATPDQAFGMPRHRYGGPQRRDYSLNDAGLGLTCELGAMGEAVSCPRLRFSDPLRWRYSPCHC
jgi:hypothetical protein